jgi:hypothetical protein
MTILLSTSRFDYRKKNRTECTPRFKKNERMKIDSIMSVIIKCEDIHSASVDWI